MPSPYRKRHPPSPTPPPPLKRQSRTSPLSFPTHHDFPNLHPTVRHICHLISTTPPPLIEPTLSSLPLTSVTPSDVETILKLSYSSPASAIKFFRWANSVVVPSPYAWNLVIDLLGKNVLFSAMWDAIRSMHAKSLLSLATFASVFSSYAAAGSFTDAIRAFDDMEIMFGIKRDTAALNSLLSALCREGRTGVARDFLKSKKREVMPDGDSYAILMEGWENEGDAKYARLTLDEMVEMLGWDPKNVPAYDSFLCCLLKELAGDALRYLGALKERRCYPGMKFFKKAMAEFVRTDDAKGASILWETLLGRNGCIPDGKMFDSMIALQCFADKAELALKYFDEMVLYGVFPDETTYNMLLQCLLKERRLKEAASIFNEMVKNEFTPSFSNCEMATRRFMNDSGWEEMGIKVWKCMMEKGYPCEEAGNRLVEKLLLYKLPEACKFAEDMIDSKVKLTSANLSKLKTDLLKIGKGNIYDHILRKWKAR